MTDAIIIAVVCAEAGRANEWPADRAPHNAGAASGVLASAQQIGNALGVAIIGVVFFGARQGGHAVPEAFRTSLLWLAAGSVAVAALIQALPRGERAAA